MNKQEYEKIKFDSWIGFCKEHPIETPSMSIGEAFAYAFDRAYALGKQEKDAEETVISGWVARDEGADCSRFYNHKPFRKKDGFKDGLWSYGMEIGLILDPTLFLDLTWESDPEQVEIIIKRKKK